MSELIRLEIESSGVALLTVQRPEVRNALNWEAMHALQALVTQLEAAENLRVVILTGVGGRSFISGGDLRDLHHTLSEEDGLRQHDLMAGTLERLAGLPVPVIAAMEGATRGGGGEVAAACDLRIAAEDATIGFPQIMLGVTPGWGGAGRLISLVGASRALDLLVSGRTLSTHEAYQIGLVDQISAPGKALDEARSLAERIASLPPLAVRGVKTIVHGYRTMPLEAARTRERSLFAQLWASDDHAEASSAFLEKREPYWKGS